MKIKNINKHVRALVVVMIMCYFTIIPLLMVSYGVENNIQGFNNVAEFSEMYAVLATCWVFGHVIFVAFMYSLYMITYGMWKDEA